MNDFLIIKENYYNLSGFQEFVQKGSRQQYLKNL